VIGHENLVETKGGSADARLEDADSNSSLLRRSIEISPPEAWQVGDTRDIYHAPGQPRRQPWPFISVMLTDWTYYGVIVS
jgi:hypothetical protein